MKDPLSGSLERNGGRAANVARMHRPSMLLTALLLAAVAVSFAMSFRYGDFGTLDFVEYWSAYQQFSNQRDPYDPQALLQIQAGLGSSFPVPIMMWNPPWLLVLLDPILRLPFSLAAQIWFVLSVGLFLSTIGLALKTLEYRPSGRSWALLFFGFLYPIWVSLFLGQMGSLLGFAALGLLVSLRSGRPFLAALCLTVFSVKLHLFLPLLIAVAWHTFVRRQFRPVLYATCMFGLLLGATVWLSPDALNHYAHAMDHGRDGRIHPLNWMTPTIPGIVRVVADLAGGGFPLWPLALIPALGVVGIAAALVVLRPSVVNPVVYSLIAFVSFATAPFGWVFDMSIYFLLHALTIQNAERSGRGVVLLAFLVLTHLASVAITMHMHVELHNFWWMPVFSVVAYWMSRPFSAQSRSAMAV